MKVKVIPIIIAFLISALIAFGMYTRCKTEEIRLLITIFCGLSMLLTLGTTLGISFTKHRTSVNIKVLSGIFATLILIVNIIFCCINNLSLPLCIILNGVLLCIWLLSVYGIHQAGKSSI